MSFLRQIWSVTLMGLGTIPVRLGTSMVIVIGVASVVAVLVAALAMASGYTRVAAGTGHPGRAIVLSQAARTESASSLSREHVTNVLAISGVKRTPAGDPSASAETIVFVPLTNASTGKKLYPTLRGVGPAVFALRPELNIIEGETFERGAHEVIVGRAAQQRLADLTVGSTISLANGEWVVSGVFESGGDSHESELMTDADTLMNAYHRNTFNSVTLELEDERAFETALAAIESDPTLSSVELMRENAYFSRASAGISGLLTIIAYGIGSIMAFGAAFGALNTMYSAVSTRAIEIATLRAIGFGALPVVVSVLIEALALAILGSFVGIAVVWFVLDGSAVSTMSTLAGITPSQVTFALQIDFDIVVKGVLAACAIAIVGGLFAAVRAARVSVATALRGT